MKAKNSLPWAFLCVVGLAISTVSSIASAQIDVIRELPCCQPDEGRGAGVVWAGTDTLMTLERLAAYCGPVLWFSPDEPLLDHVRHPSEINIPEPFPFEEPTDDPVVYYRFRTLIKSEDGVAFYPDANNFNNSLVDLSQISGIDLDFFFYYHAEEGLGGHEHDVEAVEMKLAIIRQPECAECRYVITIQQVIGKAHGILWYDNTLVVDKYTRFPITILVEEGKHASCTDANGDGYYTPGYDVNRRINDAWGVRDVMRTGALFAGSFESWFAKVRVGMDRVYPPLPLDSWVRDDFINDREYTLGQPLYTLRPYPKVAAAKEYHDPHIVHFVDKGYDDWPEETADNTVKDIGRWLDEENFVKSLSISYRYDGLSGISFVFPLLIVKNVEDTVGGGWFVNRIYLKDHNLRDIAWNILYAPSASRWIDGYFALGWEWDNDGESTKSHFMTETGIKFRGNISKTPIKFLKRLGTDFWGLRLGLQTWGFANFDRIGYAVEIGAGTF